MKRLKIYLSLILVLCMVVPISVPSFAAVYSEYEIKWLDLPAISGEIYAPTPYGFVVKDYIEKPEGGYIERSALVTDKGYAIAPSEENFKSVSPWKTVDFSVRNADSTYWRGVKDINGNTIIPAGMYNRASTIGYDRYLCAEKTPEEVSWDQQKWGVVDGSGNVIIPFGKYSWLECNGLIEASGHDGSTDILDLDGNVLYTGDEAQKVRIMGVEDRYLYREESKNVTYIRKIDGTNIATINGMGAYHPYNSIDVEEYNDATKTLTVYVYDFDGNLADTVVYENFSGKPYTYYYLEELQSSKYQRVDYDAIVDKDGNVKYSNPEYDLLGFYNEKIIKVAEKGWESMGLVDINGNVIVPLGSYDLISYCETYDVFAFEKDGQITLAKILPVRVFVNEKEIEFDQNPVIKDGRTLVPVRAILESLGANVGWDEATQTVTAKLLGIEIKLTIGSNKMYVDGRENTLDVPAEIVSGRTLVPVRAISEAFFFNVDWNGDTRTINITK